MFSFVDHFYGGFSVRVHRYLKKIRKLADMSLINSDLYVGGVVNVEFIAKEGISSILDLRKEASDDKNLIDKCSVNYLQILIPDRGTPSIKEAQKATKWIETQIQQDRKVFVHCNLGRGRGPLLIILYLISKGMNANSAINIVKERRSFTYLNKTQIKFIREFENDRNYTNDDS